MSGVLSVPILARIVVETLRICVPTVLEASTGRGGEMDLYDQRIDEWSRRLVGFADINLMVTGQEHVAPGEAFVVMSNHQSHYDIIVLFRALQNRMRMVAKKELFKIPVFAGAMRVAGFVEIDRHDRQRAVQALQGAIDALAAGTSIWIAPEGTRSETGELGPFKKGGFHLALDSGARILPVTLRGTREILRPHDWRVHAGREVHVTISEPIDPKAYGKDRREELMQAVREAIARPLNASRP